MYLSVLNDKEKVLFLELVYGIAISDGEYCAKEQAIISGYCQEMQISFDENVTLKPVDDIIKELNAESNDTVKKIVVFEAIGLAMSDNNYDDGERKIISKMESVFKLAPDFGQKCEKILNEYIFFKRR